MDERRGRKAALERGLIVTGTLGVLEAAATRNLLDLSDVILKLERTNFRIPRGLLRELRARDAERANRKENREIRPEAKQIDSPSATQMISHNVCWMWFANRAYNPTITGRGEGW